MENDEADSPMHSERRDRSTDDIDLDLVFLDEEIRSILEDGALDGDEKWIHYYLTVERYLYKKDPNYKPYQLKFRAQPGRSGRVRYTVKERPWYHRWRKYSFLSSLIGPIIGAVCSACLRSRNWCCS
jgi:hypothetical protein